jgi:hypothetical protein
VKVTIHVDDDQWAQLTDRVNLDRAKHPKEWAAAVSRLVREALFGALGPNPRSVIHAIKAEERGVDPPPESAKARREMLGRLQEQGKITKGLPIPKRPEKGQS